MKLIGFTGAAGAGKDSAARILIERYGYKKISFAAALKDVVASTFGWQRELLEGGSVESREWREAKDEWWSSKLKKDVTPRRMLQELGTDLFRNRFHSDIWILSLEKMLIDAADADNYVITDCRFENEAEMIIANGGYVVEIVRGGGSSGGHASEAGLPAKYIYEKIYNNGTIEDLGNEIKRVMR